MPRPRKEPPSPSSVVPALARYARARGLDVDLLICRFGLPPDVEESDEVLVSPDAPNELFEWVARECGEPDIALRLAHLASPDAPLPMRRYGFAELAARASATLGRALGLLARYAPLLHVDFEATLETDDREGRWIVRTPRRPRGVGRHVHEFALAHALAQGRSGSSAFGATRVWFAHARPRELEPLRAVFGTRDLDFGRDQSGMSFEKTWVDAPMQGTDGRMVATMQPLAEAALRDRVGRAPGVSLAGRVEALLGATLPAGTDVVDVASALHMSARTLQRRLEEEGTAFTEILDRVRLDRARTALADPTVTLTAVAYGLGFADLATFSRAFRRWTGKPPGQWRQGRRPPAG